MIATRLGELFRPGFPSVMKGDDIKAVDWLTSACLMVRRATLDEIGLLDENYFIYGDEVDLQYRIKKAGWQIYYLPEATIIHYGGRSMTRWPRRRLPASPTTPCWRWSTSTRPAWSTAASSPAT